MPILSHSFYARPTSHVARELLGKIIVRQINPDTVLKAMIVETEAYTGEDDQACHAHGGKRLRNAPLFGSVGSSYVYFIYGRYYCLNFVARDAKTTAGGVLIRALEPVEGIPFMQHARKTEQLHALTSGPGKLAQALSITKADNGIDITKKGLLYVLDAPRVDDTGIVITTRIGISKAADEPLRFYMQENPFVSRR